MFWFWVSSCSYDEVHEDLSYVGKKQKRKTVSNIVFIDGSLNTMFKMQWWDKHQEKEEEEKSTEQLTCKQFTSSVFLIIKKNSFSSLSKKERNGAQRFSSLVQLLLLLRYQQLVYNVKLWNIIYILHVSIGQMSKWERRGGKTTNEIGKNFASSWWYWLVQSFVPHSLWLFTYTQTPECFMTSLVAFLFVLFSLG